MRTETLQLPSNEKGRDFIVGDLHGMYDLLQEEMCKVHFDIEADRLFSVGDLTDRGVKNAECVKLLEEPWFHATLGNHDYMLCTFVLGTRSTYHRSRDFIANGGGWIDEFDKESQEQMANLILEKMPLLISTPDFFVTHALNTHMYDPSSFVWNRGIFDSLHNQGQDEIRILMDEYLACEYPIFRMDDYTPEKWCYVGHTTVKHNIVAIDGHINLDTGAYRHPEGKLSLVEHTKVMEWLK